MSRFLPWFSFVCLLSLLHSSAEAQTQHRNFNLNCGLIGKFARYPQHNHGCKAVVRCADPKTCLRKLAVPHKKLEAFLFKLEPPVATEPPQQGDTSNSGLSLSVGVQGAVSAGGVNAGGGVSAGAGTDSGGGASGSAGASVGADGVGAGGGLGIGGL
jgi:uncharacterized membrane protein YgcG